MVNNESLYYWQNFCTNPLSVKNLIPEIWTEMPLAYQTVRFLNSEVAWFDNDKIFFASIEIHENSKLI